MQWRRTTSGRLVCDMGALRAVVERAPDGRTWSARVDTPARSVASVYEYRSMREAQDWAERKLEALLRDGPPQRS